MSIVATGGCLFLMGSVSAAATPVRSAGPASAPRRAATTRDAAAPAGVRQDAPSATSPPTAGAVQTAAASPSTQPSTATPASGAPKPGTASDLDFDLLGPSAATPAPAAPEVAAVTREAKRRRTMLRWHQGLGLSMLAAMVITSVIGQLNYHDLYGGGSGSGSFLWPHRIGVGLTTAAFAATASLALLAPEPYEKPHRGFDSALVHKISAGAATAGMLAQLVLGFFTARQADAGNSHGLQTKARVHQVLGYTTLGFVSVAALSYVF